MKDDVSIVLAGAAGQGIQTIEAALTRIFKDQGFHIFSVKEYMSRIRGGSNSTEIRISNKPAGCFVKRMDLFVPLDKDAYDHCKWRVDENTQIIADKERIGDVPGAIDVPLTKMASEVGKTLFANSIAVAAILSLFGIPQSVFNDYLKKRFESKGEEIVNKNIEAATKGYEFDLKSKGYFDYSIKSEKRDEIILNGTQAVSLGAIAGGCSFVASYPMSPSTGVLTFLAGNSAKFDIAVEQAEDEICAVNMAMGGWYAGARTLVTTSGGGFALMCEGISLSGITETPLVIHLAQRPGPATGLPTRTEQGDLDLAVYAGHGEFLRMVFAPGTLDQCFWVTQRAFNMADKYQSPAFVLTDQYILDSSYNNPPFDVDSTHVEKHVVETQEGYKRYQLTENGISPRGIPGFGRATIKADSDEHDEDGRITERHDIRIQQTTKRLQKIETMHYSDDIIEPELIGAHDYKILLVGWGSTYHAMKEALEKSGRDDMAVLHYSQVLPLHRKTADYLNKAERKVIVENNATSQFGHLITKETGIQFDQKILKFDGLPFWPEEILEKLNPGAEGSR